MRTTFVLVHAALFIITAAVCAALIAADGGHPPAAILLFPAGVFWLIGHGALLLGHHWVKRATPKNAAPWPKPIAVMAFAAGFVTIVCTVFALLGLIVPRALSASGFRSAFTLVYLIPAAGPAALVYALVNRAAWAHWAAIGAAVSCIALVPLLSLLGWGSAAYYLKNTSAAQVFLEGRPDEPIAT